MIIRFEEFSKSLNDRVGMMDVSLNKIMQTEKFQLDVECLSDKDALIEIFKGVVSYLENE